VPAPASTSAARQQERRRRVRWRPDFASVGFVLVALVFISVEIIPVAWAVMLGFMHSGPFTARASYAGIDNYVQTFSDPTFWSALEVGLVYAGISVAFEVVLGIAVAILISRYAGTFVRALTLLPYVIPTVTTALVWRWMTDSLYGILNHLLLKLHLVGTPIEFTGNGFWAMALVVAASVWQFTPFVVLVIVANLGTIPPSIYEAARVDGATWWKELRYITLPMLRAPILLVVLLRSIWMFNRFDVIWLLTSGGPLGSTTTLPVYAYVQAFANNDYGLASAASTVIFVLLLVFGITYIKAFKPEQEVVRA